jgi:hypothetical protein
MLKRYSKYGGSLVTKVMQKKARLAWTHKNHEQCLDNLISILRKIKGDFDVKIKMCHEMPPDEIG